MQKTIPALLLILGSLSAAENCAPKNPAACNQDPCTSCYCLGPNNLIANAPVGPYTCDGDLTLSATALYWKATQDGMEYAIQNGPTGAIGSGQSKNLVDATYKTPKFGWNFGYRFALGYQSPCDSWDLNLTWTHYHGRANSLDQATDNIGSSGSPIITNPLIAIWSAFYSTFPAIEGFLVANSIKTNWLAKFELVDITLGREFWASRYLSIRPTIGIRLGSIEQTFNLLHRGGAWDEQFTSGAQLPLHDFVDLDNDFRGVGLRTGLDLNWGIGCGWSIYSELATSILYGSFHTKHDEYVRSTSDGQNTGTAAPGGFFTKVKLLETTDHFRAARANLDLALGIQYKALVCDCKYLITGKFGWEQHLFFHQNQLWRVNRFGTVFQMPPGFPTNVGKNDHDQRRGTLSTGGLALTFEFGF